MTRRPDAADRAQAAARHKRCVCGDRQPCTCGTPSPGWWPRSWRPLLGLIFAYLQVGDGKLNTILEEIRTMSVNTDELTKDLQRLADGYVALKSENEALKAALASADADKAQAVADAVAAGDADSQAKIDAADAIVENVSPEPATADGGEGGDAPVDGGDTPAA